MDSYDDSADRQQCSTHGNMNMNKEAPLIMLGAAAEESGRSDT